MEKINNNIPPITNTTKENQSEILQSEPIEQQLPSAAVNQPQQEVPAPGKKQQRGWQKAFNVAGNVLFGCLLIMMVALVFSMVQSRIKGGPPQVAGHQAYIVLSGSMSPTFEAGSLAFVQPLNPQKIAVGDIITFHSVDGGDTLTTHRVMQINREGDGLSFTTKGDANDINDQHPVLAGDVVGKVKFALPYAGYIMSFGQTKTGIISLVMVPGVLIIIFELRNLFRLAAEWEAKKAAQKKKKNRENSSSSFSDSPKSTLDKG